MASQNSVTALAERSEVPVLRVLHQHVPISQEKDPGPEAAACRSPARSVQAPRDLEGNRRLASAGTKSEQDARAPSGNRLDRCVDGGFLVTSDRSLGIGASRDEDDILGPLIKIKASPLPVP